MDRPLFTGLVEHSLDDKGRLVVPSRFRAQLGASFFLTILHPDGCLALYPPAQFDKLCARLEEAVAPNEADRNARVRSFQRYLFAHTDEVKCDEQGRIPIQPSLRAWADLRKNVVSIGALSRVEVWSKERYEAHQAAHADVADLTSELGLA
jgi:MraZ protein